MVPPPTPTPTPEGGGTTTVSFYLRPGPGDPCTKVLFRFQVVDAQGRPDFTKPFDIVLYNGRLRYRVALTPDTVAYLDEQYARVSPTRFRELLAERLKEEYRRHMYTGQGSTVKMSWGFTEQIQTGFRPLRIFKPELTVIQILARLWAVRATQQGRWEFQGVAWKDPACEPRPTPTSHLAWAPTPTLPAYGVPGATLTPGPFPTLPPGVPTYTPAPLLYSCAHADAGPGSRRPGRSGPADGEQHQCLSTTKRPPAVEHQRGSDQRGQGAGPLYGPDGPGNPYGM